ncbi:hypothetical protein JB92DRAFT_450298 [Gautieria morchelliformis]|nr:hypothetical protein JB92DRAFT_450298 [Gautieria morchelliformis]
MQSPLSVLPLTLLQFSVGIDTPCFPAVPLSFKLTFPSMVYWVSRGQHRKAARHYCVHWSALSSRWLFFRAKNKNICRCFCPHSTRTLMDCSQSGDVTGSNRCRTQACFWMRV